MTARLKACNDATLAIGLINSSFLAAQTHSSKQHSL